MRCTGLRLRVFVAAVVLPALLAGCVVIKTAGEEAGMEHSAPAREKDSDSAVGGKKKASKPDAEPAKKKEEERKKLDVVRRKLEIARLELADQLDKNRQAQQTAREELAEEQMKLANFNESEKPQKVNGSELDLEAARDRHQFAQEELQQLEQMYKGSELEDETSEIVLNRGRRQLQLATRRLALQEDRHRALVDRQLPLQLDELRRKVEVAEQKLHDQERQSQLEEMRKNLAIHELEVQLHDLERATGAHHEGGAPHRERTQPHQESL